MIVSSKKEQLSPEEIIKTALKQTKSQYSVEQGHAAIMAETRAPYTITLKEGNTIFIITYNPDDKSQGMFRALNADTAANYIKNSIEFIRATGMMGFKTLVTQFTEPSLLNIFKYISRHPPFEGMGYATKKINDGMYQVVINLGDTSKEKK